MTYQAILFDLDGTLLDTLEDLTCATNHVLATMNMQPIPLSACRKIIGRGARTLLREAVGTDDQAVDIALTRFLAYYGEHKYDNTQPFTGVPQTLDTLVQRGHRLAVLSNKPHGPTVEMVERLLGDWPFEQVFGQRDGVPLKPDPATALEICDRMSVTPDRCAFVGDSGEDMAAAKAAGMFAVGVTWGLRDEPELRKHGADVIIQEPMQLLDVLS